jgi:hypothetical protein
LTLGSRQITVYRVVEDRQRLNLSILDTEAIVENKILKINQNVIDALSREEISAVLAANFDPSFEDSSQSGGARRRGGAPQVGGAPQAGGAPQRSRR